MLSREIYHGNRFPPIIRNLHKCGISDEVSSPTRVAWDQKWQGRRSKKNSKQGHFWGAATVRGLGHVSTKCVRSSYLNLMKRRKTDLLKRSDESSSSTGRNEITWNSFRRIWRRKSRECTKEESCASPFITENIRAFKINGWYFRIKRCKFVRYFSRPQAYLRFWNTIVAKNNVLPSNMSQPSDSALCAREFLHCKADSFSSTPTKIGRLLFQC